MRGLLILIFILLNIVSVDAQYKPPQLDSMLRHLVVMPDDSLKVVHLCELARHYFRAELPDSCLLFANKASALGEHLHFYKGIAISHNIKGNLYGIYADYPKMLEEFLVAEKNYRAIKSQHGLGETYLNIAGVYHNIGKDSIALGYLAKAKELRTANNDTLGIAVVLTAEAIIYDFIGNGDKALELYNEAEAIFLSLNNIRGLANLYFNIATYYKSIKDYDSAISYYERSKRISKELKNIRYVANALTQLIHSYVALKELKAAGAASEELIPILGQLDDLTIKKNAYGEISAYYEVSKQFEKSLYYSRLEEQFADSLYLKEKTKQKEWVGNLTKLRDMEDAAKEHEHSEKEKDSVIAQQRLLTWLSLGALLIIGLSLYFQWQSNQKQRKINQLLEIQRQEIMMQKEALEKANATKNELFAIVSHDLMSPVSALYGILTLLKDGAIEESEIPDFLDEAMIEVATTTDFLRNLLFWAKSQMEGFSVKKDVHDLGEVAKSTLNLLEPQLRKKGIHSINMLEAKTLVFADRDLLDTVLRNLISNAVKFTANGGKIEISAAQEGHFVRVSVLDTGKGIPKSVQEKILSNELFSTRGTDNEKGNGLGLSLCKKFVEANGGEIGFESEEGKGTRFWFTVEVGENKNKMAL